MGFFTPSAGAAVKFENVGDTITGRISGALTERPAMYNGTPRTTRKGQPIMEVVVPLIDTNGNERTLYASAWRMKQAITDAVVVAGAKDVEEGGVLTVTYTGQVQGEGSSPAKAFSATYQAPGQAQQYQQPAPQQQYQQPAAPQQPQQYQQQPYQQQGYQNYQIPAVTSSQPQAPAPLTN